MLKETTYTIFEKFEKGEPKLPAGGRRGGSGSEGRPAPRPAAATPPPENGGSAMEGSISRRLKAGRDLRADMPTPRVRGAGTAGGGKVRVGLRPGWIGSREAR